MARMSIDDQFLRDPRITRLARRLGHADPDLTRGKMLHVFALCYDSRTPFADREDIETICPGMADAMIDPKINLGEETPDGILVRGASDRIGYLLKQAKLGAKGGLKSGKSRRGNKNEGSPEGSTKEPLKGQRSLSSAPDSALPPVSPPEEEKKREEQPLDPSATWRRKFGDQIWQQYDDARAEIAAITGERVSRILHHQPGRLLLATLIKTWADQNGQEVTESRVRHVLAVAIDKAKEKKSAKWLDTRLFKQDRAETLEGWTASPLPKPPEELDPADFFPYLAKQAAS